VIEGIKNVYQDISSELAEHGVEARNEPTNRGELFEALATAGIVLAFQKKGYDAVGSELDLSKTNQVPRRRPRQGSAVGREPDKEGLARWMNPVFTLTNDKHSVSIYREGVPFHQGKLRPDIVVYPARFEIHARKDVLLGDVVKAEWNNNMSGYRTYRGVATEQGPVCVGGEGDLKPILGLEVSTNKRANKLDKQLQFLRQLGCTSVGAVLDHEDPRDDPKHDAQVVQVMTYNSFKKTIQDFISRAVGGNR
jgi:hypothetical protein